MPSNPIRITVTYDRLPEIRSGIHAAVDRVIRKATLDIQGHAINDAPVDTGNLKNSILPEFPKPLSGRVTVNADYGIYVNYGTYRNAANPFFSNAVNNVLPTVQPAIAAAIRGVR